MAAITGFSGVVKAVTSGGTLAAVSELKSWSVEESVDTVENTVMGDSVKSFTKTLKGWTGSCELNYEPGDAVQADLLIGESIDLEFYPGGTGASTKWGGTAIVTGTSSSGDSGDLVGSSITFQGTGALTVTA